MLRIKNYFIAFAVVFAISSAYALIGVQDAKAQEGAALGDLIKRIEALESKGGGGNVTAGKIRGLKIGFNMRHRYENRRQDFTSITSGAANNPVNNVVNRWRRWQQTRTSQAGRAHQSRKVGQDFTVQRVRLNFDADVNKNVRGFIMLQDARTWGEENSTAGNLQRTDMQEAYVDLRNLGDLSSILSNTELRIGRWQAAYGNQRLIGHLNWANQARSYDGARVKYSNKKNLWVDFFAWQVKETATGGVDGGGVLSTTPDVTKVDELLWGLYAQYKFDGFLKGNLIEPYLIIRDQSSEQSPSNAAGTTRPNKEERYTAGFRLVGKNMSGLGGLDYTVEPAWQFGTTEYSPDNVVDDGSRTQRSEPIQAWAIYAGTGYRFKDLPWQPRIGYAYTFASGDDNYGRGSAKTFDHIYPTGHAQLGYMDYAAWQNMRNHQIHLNLKPTKKLVVDTKVHFFNLDEEADSWYSVAGGVGGGAVNGGGVVRRGAHTFIDPQTGVEREIDDEIGQEVDITLKYKLLKNFGIVAGYSHFFAGDFVEDTGAGVDRGVDWFYLQTTMKF